MPIYQSLIWVTGPSHQPPPPQYGWWWRNIEQHARWTCDDSTVCNGSAHQSYCESICSWVHADTWGANTDGSGGRRRRPTVQQERIVGEPSERRHCGTTYTKTVPWRSEGQVRTWRIRRSALFGNTRGCSGGWHFLGGVVVWMYHCHYRRKWNRRMPRLWGARQSRISWSNCCAT